MVVSKIQARNEWRLKTIYHIYPRSFYNAENKSGNGDLAGIIAKLDYLQDLGVDVIYLSPVYASPMKDNGYDIEDYLDIHPMFGDQKTMDRLIFDLHERKMKVMMDFVPNHTSDKHKWFQESRSSKDNPKRNWYHWLPGKPDGSPPNNWINVFDNTPGSAWTYDDQTKEYYLHSFLKEQPDLNWDNPEVEKEMHRILLTWMDRGVDAFRIDVGLYIVKNPKYPDEPLNPAYVAGVDHPNEIYSHQASKDQMRGFKKLADMGNLVGSRGGFVIQEVYVGTEERAILYRLSEYGLSVPFDFDLILGPDWSAYGVRKIIFDYYALLKKDDIVPLPLGNHDQPRVATRLGSQKDARLAAMLQMTLDCLPVVFQGEEIGMVDVEIPPEKRQDPFVDKLRDPARTPMQWDDTDNAGFTKKGIEPWLPVDPNYKETNVKKQLLDSRSMLSLYKHLISIRKERLMPGRPKEVVVNNDNVLAYKRNTADGKKALILLNFAEEQVTIHIKSSVSQSGRLLINTSIDNQMGKIFKFDNFTLEPKEGYIFLA